MLTRFLVLTTPRSGSRWLAELIDAHPNATAYGEAFLADGAGDMRSGSGSFPYFTTYLTRQPAWSARARRLQRARYLEALYASGGEAHAVGYKLMVGQDARNPGVLRWSGVRRVRAIHLVRRNVLRSLVSHLVARERGAYHPRRGDDLEPVLVTVDTAWLLDEMEKRLASVAGGRARLARFRLPTLELSYEELVADTATALMRVWPFLGLEAPRQTPDTTLVRAVASLEDVVANVDEVRAALRPTPHAWMLEDAL